MLAGLPGQVELSEHFGLPIEAIFSREPFRPLSEEVYGAPDQVLYMALFFWIIRPISSEISERKASELDERQVSVRDRAYHHAYEILAVILVMITTAPLSGLCRAQPISPHPKV